METQGMQEEKHIAIYPRRSQVLKWLILLVAFDSFFVFCLLQYFPSIQPLLIVHQAMYLPWLPLIVFADLLHLVFAGFLLIFLPYLHWMSFTVLRNVVSPQCVFAMNRQCVLIHRQPFIKSAFLPWNTITKLDFTHSSPFQGTRLFLSLRDITPLFSSRFQRMCWRWFSGQWRGYHRTNVLVVHPWFLTMSEKELASHIQHVFHQELAQYEIQAQPYESQIQPTE
jgi:hypothetical protein